MNLTKITFLVGSPGCGKSTVGNELVQQDPQHTLFIDDISILVKDNPEEYIKKKIQNTLFTHLIIADVNFCFKKIREQAVNKIENFFNLKVDLIFFENNLKKCLHNIETRVSAGDNRKVVEMAKLIHESYDIPSGVDIRSIHCSTLKKLKP